MANTGRDPLGSRTIHNTLGRKLTMRTLVFCLVVMLATFVSVANAEVQVNERQDIVITTFVACANGGAGETIELSGPLHTLITFTINGNNVSGKWHHQPQGISGIGMITGMSYQATGVTQQTFKTSLQNGQANLTYVNNFRIIGQGPGNNFLVHENFHFTINANGEATVTHDNFSAECK